MYAGLLLLIEQRDEQGRPFMKDPNPHTRPRQATRPKRCCPSCLPEIPGAFPGKQCHASERRLCCLLLGKRSVCSICTALQNCSPIRLCGLLPALWATTLSKGLSDSLSVCLPLKCQGAQRPRSRDYTGRVSQDHYFSGFCNQLGMPGAGN